MLSAAHAYQIGSAKSDLLPGFLADAALLERTPKLVAVSTHGAGYDTIDLAACTRAGVVAVNQSGGNAEAVAEHILGMMLGLSKRIVELDRLTRRQAGLDRNRYLGHDLLGKTLGIVGIGHVGTRTARLCGGLFKMRVLAVDPYLTESEVAARGAQKTTLERVLRESDFVSVSCPLTEETKGMIGRHECALMREGALFFNTARGGIHDEAALLEALRSGHLAGAGLDVWDVEPPPLDHPLLQLDNVIATPHLAGVTHESRENTAHIAAKQLIGILDGERPPRLLNPQVWPAYVKRFERVFGFAPHESDSNKVV